MGTLHVLCSLLHLRLTLQLHTGSISTACVAVTALNSIPAFSKELFGSTTKSGTNCIFLILNFVFYEIPYCLFYHQD